MLEEIARDILIVGTLVFAFAFGWALMDNWRKWHRRRKLDKTMSMRKWVESELEDGEQKAEK